MTTFHGGPADQVVLALARSPLLLRVVYDDRRDEFDALDKLDDQVGPNETAYVYLRSSEPFTGMIDYSTGRGHQGQRFSSAEYRFIDRQPPQPIMRSNASWREWCRAAAAKLKSVPVGKGAQDATDD